MKCGNCTKKRIHLISVTGKVYWICNEKRNVVHAFDKCYKHNNQYVKPIDSTDKSSILIAK